jgi:hypothetical protein
MGFSFPEGLFSLGFLAVLVWLYLRERHQHELEVPSLILWRAVRDEVQRSRFRPDLLFLLQAALLAALGIGMSRPYRAERSAPVTLARAVLVFDTSASMQTFENGERRFDQARRKAQEFISGLAGAEEMMVIAVESQPRIALAFSGDRQAVARAVEALEPGDGPSRLALGIQLARSVRGPTGGTLEIAVFTDLPRAELSLPPSGGESLHYFRFGRSDDNLALAAFRVYQSPFQDAGEARAYALVKNYSHAEKEADLHVVLAGREVLREHLRLGPREGRAVPVRSLSEPGRLEARLDVSDAFSVDNQAAAYVRPIRRIRLLVVTPSPEVAGDLRRISSATAAFDLREVSPEEVRSEELRSADVAIFHDYVPSEPMAANALFLYPPAQNPLFPAEREVRNAQILDWNERDSILHDLRYVEALPLERARMIRLPPWAHTLISSRTGAEEFPLAFAGELRGRRVVCFAFDLAGRSVRKSENLSLLLLVLNSLKWLTPPDPALPLQIDVGDRFRETLTEPQPVVVTDPSGGIDTRPPVSEVAVDITRHGEYRLRIGGEQRIIYANLFDAEESDIGREGPMFEEAVEKGSASATSEAAPRIRDVASWLYRIGFLLLLVEWLYAHRRRNAENVE